MNQPGYRADHGLRALAWFSYGIIAAGLFATAQLPPLRVTILLLAASSVVAMASLRVTEMSILSRLFVLLFTLPFSATLGYLFDVDYVWWHTRNNVVLCQNHRLIDEMLFMVIVGLCGMMLGFEVGAMKSVRTGPAFPGQVAKPPIRRTLPMPAVWFLLLLSFALSWLHAPEKSILAENYMSADSGMGKDMEAGLNSSCLISYAILILLCVDAEQESQGSRRQWQKLISVGLVTTYIVLVLQLLRGDRECAGLVAALVALYITSPATVATRARIRQSMVRMSRAFKLFIPLSACVVAFLALGALRHTASQSSGNLSVWQTIVDGATQNTWTAVALNNLGLAADYNYGTIEYLYGQTYFDYFLSLPPGAITKLLGYERPMEGAANPSVWYHRDVTAGGMHPVVVPFKNLGILGVLGILFLCGLFICRCEQANERGTLSGRLIYGCLATGSMMWFWYGDMSLVRTLMCWAILIMLHRFVANPTSRVRQPSQTLPPRPAPTPRRLAVTS